MSPTLRNMLAAALVLSIGGVGIYVSTTQPATRTMAELRDGGITDGQPVVLECPARLTKQTRRRIDANQPGALRPGQSYAHVARTARCFSVDGGNCVNANTGAWRIGSFEGEVAVPSLRANLSGVDLDAGVADVSDGGDSSAVDDAFQYDSTSCVLYGCAQYDALIDAGLRANPFTNRFCNALNRLALVPSPCMIPNGWGRAPDGGWCEEECGGPVDCRFGGPYAESDGGPRWRGFNVGPAQYAVGAACVPVECSVVAGDVPQEWL